MRFPHPLIALLLLVLAAGCATPAQREDRRAAELGYRKLLVTGTGFEHVVYLKAGHAGDTSALHVYLEGDGTPWRDRHVAASDPTPRNPLMLELMALDPAPSIYLGRPCYHGVHPAPACSADIWTDRRYSTEVVDSLSGALSSVSGDYPALVLLGYSGGGVLAMLLAERQPKTVALITVAANLDTARWAALHGQPPLSASLNPAGRAPLPAYIRQMHFAGADDDNVPPALVREALAGQRGAVFTVLAGQDHRCCWQRVWPDILSGLSGGCLEAGGCH